MGFKLFGRLGIFNDPDSADGQDSSAEVDVSILGKATLSVDHTQEGWQGSRRNTLPSNNVQKGGSPMSMGGLGSNVNGVGDPSVMQSPHLVANNDPKIFSQTSVLSPYETLYYDFQLEAHSYYNFWTPDEMTNDRDDLGGRSLADVPRYIKLSWKPAPDIPDPNRKLDRRNQQYLNMNPTTTPEAGQTFAVNGILFSPDHLQPDNFALAVNSLSNGYIEPGYLNAVAELPLHNAGADYSSHSQIEGVQHIDEDAFLTHPEMIGISIHELQGQIKQLTNGTVGSTAIAKAKISAGATIDRDKLVNGEFVFHKPIKPGGFVQIHGVSTATPGISLVARSSVPTTEAAQVDRTVELASKISLPENVSAVQQIASVNVKFIDPSVGGLVDANKVNLMTRPEHVESMMSVAHVLPQLYSIGQAVVQQFLSSPKLPSFQAPDGVSPLTYVGYIIEKYEQDETGAFTHVADFELPDRVYDEYFDTQIRYGTVYRYRIRGVIRWTRPMDVGPLGKDPTIIVQNGSQTAKLSPNLSSYFGTEWSNPWAYSFIVDHQPPAPPDELTARPDSSRRRISVSFKLPNNPQKDIYKMRLMRKLRDEDGNDLTGWTQLGEYGSVDRVIDFGPQNVLYIDTDVDYFQDNKIVYVYAAQSVSRHEEDSTLSEQLGCSLNKNFAVFGEHPVRFVSCSGVKLEHFGSFATNPHKTFHTEVILQPAYSEGQTTLQMSFTLAGREAVGSLLLDKGQYLVRVESLDTGQKFDTVLNTTFSRIRDVVSSITNNSYVPDSSLGTRRASRLAQRNNPAVDGQLGSPGDSFSGTKRRGRGTRRFK